MKFLEKSQIFMMIGSIASDRFHLITRISRL